MTEKIQMQRIDISKIPDDFEFKETDKIYDFFGNGYWIEIPNNNLNNFVFGDVKNTFKIIRNETN